MAVRRTPLSAQLVASHNNETMNYPQIFKVEWLNQRHLLSTRLVGQKFWWVRRTLHASRSIALTTTFVKLTGPTYENDHERGIKAVAPTRAVPQQDISVGGFYETQRGQYSSGVDDYPLALRQQPFVR